MRVAGLVHDGRKSGEQTDYECSKFTKFDHPIQMANVIRNYDGQYLNHDELEFIAHCVESHMGQWATDRKSKVVLPKPIDEYQQFVHLADYLASRKDLTMSFDSSEQEQKELPDINTYIINFGKMKGHTIPEIAKIDISYLYWAKDNLSRMPESALIKDFLSKKQENVI